MRRCIEPDGQNIAVTGQQLIQLRLIKFFDIALQVFGAFLRVIPEIPVVTEPIVAPVLFIALCQRVAPFAHVGIVQTELHAVTPTGVGQLGNDIAPERRGVYHVEVADGGLEHGEAVVVLGGQNNVFHAGLLGEHHPIVRVEGLRIKFTGQLFILLYRDTVGIHIPFALCRNTVNSPVEEQAELHILPCLYIVL